MARRAGPGVRGQNKRQTHTRTHTHTHTHTAHARTHRHTSPACPARGRAGRSRAGRTPPPRSRENSVPVRFVCQRLWCNNTAPISSWNSSLWVRARACLSCTAHRRLCHRVGSSKFSKCSKPWPVPLAPAVVKYVLMNSGNSSVNMIQHVVKHQNTSHVKKTHTSQHCRQQDVNMLTKC